jgi:hypothetical protein
MEAPPPILKASGTLSEREGTEVEIISRSNFDFPWSIIIDLIQNFSSTLITIS